MPNNKLIVLVLCGSILLSCTPDPQTLVITREKNTSPANSSTPWPLSITPNPTGTPVDVSPSRTPNEITPSGTPTTLHLTGTGTGTNTSTPTPTWVYNNPGEVVAPILLYHHIEESQSESRYSVSTEAFSSQLQRLHSLGYVSITISTLIDALVDGSILPSRPVVITFDDGAVDVYDNAYPIMEKFGFVGVMYIVANRRTAEGFVNLDQMKELLDAGWEIGSHGMTHNDLTINHALARDEILTSRLSLNENLSIEVISFAYPFGLTDGFVSGKVAEYGYRAAVGLGKLWRHTSGSIYNLNRIEVRSEYDLDTFTSLLPWSQLP